MANNITSISYTEDHTSLNELHSLLRAPKLAPLSELEGMFFRLEDFSVSFSQFYRVFKAEYFKANTELVKGLSAEELFKSTNEKLGLVMATENEFYTRELTPTVRHFINDACRIIEPLAPLLIAKFPQIKMSNKPSFNLYLEFLVDEPPQDKFDFFYIRELYEIWNDYKHRSTKGLQLTAWKFDSGKILKPKLILPNNNYSFNKLRNIEVDHLIQTTTEVIRDLANYLLSDSISL